MSDIGRFKITIRHIEARTTRQIRAFPFNEHGALMAATILNSSEAVQRSGFVIRTFVKMRGLLTEDQ